MSRKSLEDEQQWLLAGTLTPTQEHVDGESEFPNELNNNKKCTDWTAYLDNDDHQAVKRAEQEDHGYLLFILFQFYDMLLKNFSV